jgi:hypothetical protein
MSRATASGANPEIRRSMKSNRKLKQLSPETLSPETRKPPETLDRSLLDLIA